MCNHVFDHHVYHGLTPPRCDKCYPLEKNRSYLETEIEKFISPLYAVKTNIKINKKEIDVYVPEKKCRNRIKWNILA